MELNLVFLGFMLLITTLLLPMAQSFSPCDFPIPAPTATCSNPLPPTHNVYTFTVEEVDCSRYCNDGPILTVNGHLPGPTIVVRKKNNSPVNVTVNVFNNGPTGITIHWHGVRQPSNPWHDGPEYITQCPIPSKGKFTQNIIFTDEVGTLLWHAHSEWSRATVHGAIVILPEHAEDNPYKYDCEQTIVLASWYKNVPAEYEKAANHKNPDDAEAYTINGYVGKSPNTTPCNKSTNYTEPMFIVPVAPSKTYLLRIINAVMNEQMFFSIAKHRLTVVGIDGAYVEHITKDYIVIGAGNTIDVLVNTTANLSGANYYMAARQYTNGKTVSTVTTAAILQYTTSASAHRFFPDDTLPDVNNSNKAEAFLNQIKSYKEQDVPSKTTGTFKQYFTNVAVYPGGYFTATISDFGFKLPSVDLLKTSAGCISSGKECDKIEAFPTAPSTNFRTPLSYKTAAIVVEHNDVVELVLQGAASGAEDHPFHVHGHSFYLLASKYNSIFNETAHAHLYNLTHPPLLNTVAVPKQGWAVIRFKADNPGVWFIHCHLDRHSVWGMATALIVKESGGAVKMGTRPSDMPACTAPASP